MSDACLGDLPRQRHRGLSGRLPAEIGGRPANYSLHRRSYEIARSVRVA
jgi:hypothetical protein